MRERQDLTLVWYLRNIESSTSHPIPYHSTNQNVYVHSSDSIQGTGRKFDFVVISNKGKSKCRGKVCCRLVVSSASKWFNLVEVSNI